MPELLPVTVAAVASEVTRVRNGRILPPENDDLSVEEPLEIRLQWLANGECQDEPLTITMRTPGHDRELVAGLLFSEGIIRESGQLQQLVVGDNPNSVTALLAPGHQLDIKKYQRHFYSTSSCGVCGKMAIESLRLLARPELKPGLPMVPVAVIEQLPSMLAAAQSVFQQTGGVHAAGLFDPHGKMRVICEDVGRHNAVDKVLGSYLLANALPLQDGVLQDSVLLVSGRAGFELVQKALMANIAVMVAVGAPTSLAVAMAQAYNMTLVGFARNQGFNIYSAPERIG